MNVASPTLIPQEALAGLGKVPDALVTRSPIPIHMANGVRAHALHINGLSPHTYQQYTYLMTCNPCLRVHDFYEVIKDILQLVSDNPEAASGMLPFSEVNLAGGEWRNPLIRMRIDSAAHARLHGVLLHQLDTFTSTARSDNEDSDIIPWFELTYNTPLPFGQLNLPVNERTSANIATLIKNRL
jgi:hypothetical protein